MNWNDPSVNYWMGYVLGLAWGAFAGCRWRNAHLEDQLDQARALAEWKPITPDSLPKLDDQLIDDQGDTHCVIDQHDVEQNTFEDYVFHGMTHFRPINRPASVATKEGE